MPLVNVEYEPPFVKLTLTSVGVAIRLPSGDERASFLTALRSKSNQYTIPISTSRLRHHDRKVHDDTPRGKTHKKTLLTRSHNAHERKTQNLPLIPSATIIKRTRCFGAYFRDRIIRTMDKEISKSSGPTFRISTLRVYNRKTTTTKAVHVNAIVGARVAQPTSLGATGA